MEVPELLVHLLDELAAPNARVVDEDVAAAEVGENLPGGLADALAGLDVHGVSPRRPAGLADLLRLGLGSFGIHIHDRDGDAGGGELLTQRASDASRAARDDGNAIGKSHSMLSFEKRLYHTVGFPGEFREAARQFHVEPAEKLDFARREGGHDL